MAAKDNLREKRELALSVADQIEWELEPVECDDYGDDEWKWHIVFYLVTDKGRYVVYDDYYRKKPDDVVIYNNMLESIKDGSMGDNIVGILTQEK